MSTTQRLTRKQLIDLVLSKLALIRTQNGFQSDIGANVLSYEKVGAQLEIDACTVVDGKEEYASTTGGIENAQRTLQLAACFGLVGNDSRERSYLVLEDVIKWLSDNKSFGQRFLRVELVSIDLETVDTDDLTELVAELRLTY